MTRFNDKSIFEGDITVGNPYRQSYADSVNSFLDKMVADSVLRRDEFMRDIVTCQQKYREDYIKMIGIPVTTYPDSVPNVKSEFIGKDDFCDIYYMQIETMPDFWFFGIL